MEIPESIWNLIYQVGVISIVPIAGALATSIIYKIKLQSLSITTNTWEKVKVIVKIAVESSEQQYNSGAIVDRKAHALDVAKMMIAKRKLKFDEDMLSELIEAQVWSSLNSPAATGLASPIPEEISQPNII